MAELFTGLVDQFIASLRILNGILPLEVQLVSLLMQTLKLMRCLVKLNLCGLCLSNFLLQLLALVSNFNGQLLNLKR